MSYVNAGKDDLGTFDMGAAVDKAKAYSQGVQDCANRIKVAMEDNTDLFSVLDNNWVGASHDKYVNDFKSLISTVESSIDNNLVGLNNTVVEAANHFINTDASLADDE